MTGSPVWCHVFDDLYRGGFQRKVCHDKTDRSRRTAEESKWFPDRGIKRHVQRLGSAGGIGEFQMPGITDIEFSGIFFGEFQCDLYGAAHIRDTVAADNDKVSVTAPSFGIPRKFDGNDLGVGRFYGFVSCIDLSGCTGTGA